MTSADFSGNGRVSYSLPTAVIFDGDGVLFDSEGLTNQSFIRLIASRGVKLTMEEIEPFIGVGTDRLLPMLRERHGVHFEMEDYVKVREDFYEEECREAGGIPQMSGVNAVLDWLESRHLPFALATGATTRKMTFNLSQAGLQGRIPVCVSADDVVNGKPSPDVYLEAMRRLGINPAGAYIVEDTLPGLKGARAAGCVAVGLAGTYTVERLAPHADLVFANHADFLRWLMKAEERQTT